MSKNETNAMLVVFSRLPSTSSTLVIIEERIHARVRANSKRIVAEAYDEPHVVTYCYQTLIFIFKKER